MADAGIEQIGTPETVDNSYDAMMARLTGLQQALSELMGKAFQLFDDVYPQTRQQMEIPERPFVVYKNKSRDTCPIEFVPSHRELTIVLSAGKWVRIFRNSESTPDNYPSQRLWFRCPEGEGERQVNIMRTHSPSRKQTPFDIETSDFGPRGTHIGFVGGGAYAGQEPFIAETNLALDEARLVAQSSGLVVPT